MSINIDISEECETFLKNRSDSEENSPVKKLKIEVDPRTEAVDNIINNILKEAKCDEDEPELSEYYIETRDLGSSPLTSCLTDATTPSFGPRSLLSLGESIENKNSDSEDYIDHSSRSNSALSIISSKGEYYDNILAKLETFIIDQKKIQLNESNICNYIFYDETQLETMILKSKNKYMKKNHKGESILHQAVHKKNLIEVQNILSNCPYLINFEDNVRWIPLHDAIYTQNFQMVEALVKAGASVNAVGGDYSTPLAIAVDVGNLEIAKFLIESGADINAKDLYGKTPMDTTRQDFKSYFQEILKNESYLNICTYPKPCVPISICNVFIHNIENEVIRNFLSVSETLWYNGFDGLAITNRFRNSTTHFVTSSIIPCRHLLAAILSGKWILKLNWLEQYIATGEANEIEHQHKECLTGKSIFENNIPLLFDGMQFAIVPGGPDDKFYTKDNISFDRNEFSNLVRLGGGKINHRVPPPSACRKDIYPWHLNGTSMEGCSNFAVYASNCKPQLAYNMAELKTVSVDYIVQSIMKCKFSNNYF